MDEECKKCQRYSKCQEITDILKCTLSKHNLLIVKRKE